jgi:hypothetical protein
MGAPLSDRYRTTQLANWIAEARGPSSRKRTGTAQKTSGQMQAFIHMFFFCSDRKMPFKDNVSHF